MSNTSSTLKRASPQANTQRVASAHLALASDRPDQNTQPVALTVKQWREKAIELHHKGDDASLDQALGIYKSILKVVPQDVLSWNNIGTIYRKRKLYQSAVNCYRRLLAIEPNDVAALSNLGNALKDLNRFEEALVVHQQVIKQEGSSVKALMNYAVVLRENKQLDEALTQLEIAQQLEPDNAKVAFERAQCLLQMGRFREGFIAYEARLRTSDFKPWQVDCPLWSDPLMVNDSRLTGKTLLLLAEQGYGDAILMSRYVPLMKRYVGETGVVILVVRQELHRLFSKLDADFVVTPEQLIQAARMDFTQSIPRPDIHCSLMSLPAIVGTDIDTVPACSSLHIPNETKKKFEFIAKRYPKAQYPDLKKIGIVWSGSLTFKNNHKRALSLSDFLPLAAHDNIKLFSLQKGPRQQDLLELGADAYIEDIGALCDDFADTAAAIERLDLIVMTDSSVAHVAGSLHKPVLNLMNHLPYCMYALNDKNTTTPWYPNTTFYNKNADWQQYLLEKYVVSKSI